MSLPPAPGSCGVRGQLALLPILGSELVLLGYGFDGSCACISSVSLGNLIQDILKGESFQSLDVSVQT